MVVQGFENERHLIDFRRNVEKSPKKHGVHVPENLGVYFRKITGDIDLDVFRV
jgi:hypothetical protein